MLLKLLFGLGKCKGSIYKIRRQIDKIDRSIIDLLAERCTLVEKIKNIKDAGCSSNGVSYIKPEREFQMIEDLKHYAIKSGNKYSAILPFFFRSVITMSNKIEQANFCIGVLNTNNRIDFESIRSYYGFGVDVKVFDSFSVLAESLLKCEIGVALIKNTDLDSVDKFALESVYRTNTKFTIFAKTFSVNNDQFYYCASLFDSDCKHVDSLSNADLSVEQQAKNLPPKNLQTKLLQNGSKTIIYLDHLKRVMFEKSTLFSKNKASLVLGCFYSN